MKIQKINQTELVEYIDRLDEELNNKATRNILYDEYMKSSKKQRATKTDKRHVIIAKLVRDNFNTQIGETTVWRVLKIKKASNEIFNEVKEGNKSIKEAYNILYAKQQLKEKHKKAKNDSKVSISNSDDILNTLNLIEQSLDNEIISPKKLRTIDDELFALRKKVFKLIQDNDQELSEYF